MAYMSDDFYDKAWPQYSKFMTELTKLSRKYGVAVSGHFDIDLEIKNFKDLTYDMDISSGDVSPRNYWEEEDAV